VDIFKTKTFALRLHPAGLLLIGLLVMSGQRMPALIALLSLLIHESFHLLALGFLKAPLRQVELTPFGGIMDVETFQSLPVRHRVGIAASGVLGSVLAGLLCFWIPGEKGFLRDLGGMSLALGLWNALPVLPMDGGQVLAALGDGHSWGRKLRKALMVLGVVLGFGLMALAIYGAWHGYVNLTLLMVGPYLCYAARQAYVTQRMRLVERNLNLQAKLKQGRLWKVEGIALPVGMNRREMLACLLDRHPSRFYYFFWVEPETGKVQEVWEERRMMEEVLK